MTEAAQRKAWKSFHGNAGEMMPVGIGAAEIKVARPTVDAWRALEAIFDAHGYDVRAADSHGFFVRNVKGTQVPSLHSFGIAIDINAQTNPLRETPDRRKVRFSRRSTQVERARDVEAGAADTDMDPAMIEDVRAVLTRGGQPVFGWGGWWTSRKDTMHFHIDVAPGELGQGIDWSTVRGADGVWAPGDPGDGWHDHDHSHDDEGYQEGEAMNAADFDLVERFRPMLDFIARHEGTAGKGDYNCSLGYGAFTGGEQNLVGMTLDEIDALQRRMLNHPRNRLNSSALGRYQIVGKTLRDLRRQLGLSGHMLFSPELQDRCAVALIQRRGRSASGLRLEWASLQRVGDRGIYAAYDARGERSDDVPVDPWKRGLSDDRWDDPPEPGGGGSAGGPFGGTFPPRGGEVLLKPGDRGEQVRALQETLSKLNYQLGELDGVYGSLTTGAVAAFQIDYNVPVVRTGWVDTATWRAMSKAPGRPLSERRRRADAGELRRGGSQTVANADRTRVVGWASGGLGALGLGYSGLEGFDLGTGAAAGGTRDLASAIIGAQDTLSQLFPDSPGVAQLIDNARDVVAAGVGGFAPVTGAGDALSTLASLFTSVLPGPGGSLAMLGVGVLTHIFGSRIISQRVEDQRRGANLSPLRD